MKPPSPFLAVVFTSILLVTGCTDNNRAKNFGGTMTLDLDPGRKLVEVTWKDNQMWVLTRPMRPGEQPETYTFKEKSSYGVWEGTVILNERAAGK